MTTSGHLGTWAYENVEVYVGYEFEEPDKCRFVGAAKGHAGTGGYCSYKFENNAVSITEVWDNTNSRYKVPAPYYLMYDSATDTLSIRESGKEIRLVRVLRLWEKRSAAAAPGPGRG